jgi:hypothetical protein
LIRSGPRRWIDHTIRFDEEGSSFGIGFDLPAVLVDEAMVKAAEQDQVLQIGGTKIGPVFAVMTVDEMFLQAARESAAPIPEPELTS